MYFTGRYAEKIGHNQPVPDNCSEIDFSLNLTFLHQIHPNIIHSIPILPKYHYSALINK